MKILIIIALTICSFMTKADLIQDKDGDLYYVDINTGVVSDVHENKKYAPYKIISTNLIQDKDGDIYLVNSKSKTPKVINLKERYAPYKSIK